MEEYGTDEANHDAVDQTKKFRFGIPKYLLAHEVLSTYCLRDLGAEETIR